MAEDDDATIQDACRLFRRIPIQPNTFINWDANQNVWIISSQAFRNNRQIPAISINIESILQAENLPIESIIVDPQKYAVASITARLARDHAQRVQKKPEENDASHGHVAGEKPKPVERALAKGALWVIAPPNPENL